MAFVADASIVLAWALETQATPLTRASLVKANEQGFVAPHHFPIEVAYGLIRAERHQRASRNEIDLFLLDLKRMRIRLDDPIDIARSEDLITLARRYALSGHDAAYLDLALRTALPLATRDGALAAAADRAGIALIQP